MTLTAHGARATSRPTTRLRLAALVTTFGLAAAAWVVAVRQMTGMDMGPATSLGPVTTFAVLWVSMMAAMMLPGAAPAVVRQVEARARLRALPPFVASYLAVWAAVGVVVYAADRPHGTAAAGAVVVAAGCYELSPVKRSFRQRCREGDRSGFAYGSCCVGSSVGLMAVAVALGLMSLTWMVVVAVLALAQKLLPPRAAVDVPVALAVLGLGAAVLSAPASVPGLALPM
jgi:predicted metal-binding membrane protein